MKIRFLIILTLVGFLSLISFIPHYAYASSTIEEYCKYSVENQLPTPWDYYCYDDPFDNPAREADLEYREIIDDYTKCDTRDSIMACFEYSLKTCRPSISHQSVNTGEGDPIYYEVFLKEDCTFHIIIDTQRDMHSSPENRGLFHTVCPQLEWIDDNHILIDSCEELEPFNDYYELFHINKEKSESENNVDVISGQSESEPVPPHTSEELDEMCRTGKSLCQPTIESSSLSDRPYWIDFLRTFFESIQSIFVK